MFSGYRVLRISHIQERTLPMHRKISVDVFGRLANTQHLCARLSQAFAKCQGEMARSTHALPENMYLIIEISSFPLMNTPQLLISNSSRRPQQTTQCKECNAKRINIHCFHQKHIKRALPRAVAVRYAK